jgi:hypothetical protein
MKILLFLVPFLAIAGCNKCDRFEYAANLFESVYPEVEKSTNLIANSSQGPSTQLSLTKYISSNAVNQNKKHCFDQEFISLKFTDNLLGFNFELYLRPTAWGGQTLGFEQKFGSGSIHTSLYDYTISESKMSNTSYGFDTSDFFISRNVRMTIRDSLSTEFGVFNDVYEFVIQDNDAIENERFIKSIYIHKRYGLLRFSNLNDQTWDVEVIL